MEGEAEALTPWQMELEMCFLSWTIEGSSAGSPAESEDRSALLRNAAAFKLALLSF